MIKIYRIVLLVFLCMTSVYAYADIIGVVQKVVDGDTIHLTDDNGNLHKEYRRQRQMCIRDSHIAMENPLR